MKYIIFVRACESFFYWDVNFSDRESNWSRNRKDATIFKDRETARKELQFLMNSQGNVFYDRDHREIKVYPRIKEVK